MILLKRSINLALIVILTLFLGITCLYETTALETDMQVNTEISAPIYIDGNISDWVASEKWDGSGTELDPYIIEDLKFLLDTAVPSLYIGQTTEYFVIQTSEFVGNGTGIYLEDSSNGRIELSTFNGEIGIELDSSSNIFIGSNLFLSNEMYGVHSYGTSQSNSFFDNVFEDIGDAGMLLEGTGMNNISYNDFSLNAVRGAAVTSDDNLFGNNIFAENNGYGVEILGGAEGNSVITNAFISNGIFTGNYSGSQALDNGVNTEFQDNSWDDWLTPDDDEDGIVDVPYDIDGNANNQDPVPVSTSPHFISDFILDPFDDDTITGDLLLNWDETNDSYAHDITYSVFASSGSNTTTLASDLTGTSLLYDSTQLIDGSYTFYIIAYDGGFLETSSNSIGPYIVDNVADPTTSSPPPTSTETSGGFLTIPGAMLVFSILGTAVIVRIRSDRGSV